jgi:cystathionine beta-lyase/cystathionine gamma-synthase
MAAGSAYIQSLPRESHILFHQDVYYAFRIISAEFLVRWGCEASRVKLFVNATSLGGVESLLEHRASSEGPASRTPEDLLRLSVGLEHPTT